jgi:S-formylglutathione hydrolase FrmB
MFLTQPLFDALFTLGRRAPMVLLLDGGSDSYWHDRTGGKWGSMVIREAIPAGIRRTHATRVAIGGVSMGGYGALLLGGKTGVCAVAARSPALWLSGTQSAPGAFDDAGDYARNDIVGRPPRYHGPVWIDVGTKDPFRNAAVAYAHEVHAQLHIWPGGHTGSYWRAHELLYLRFVVDACR